MIPFLILWNILTCFEIEQFHYIYIKSEKGGKGNACGKVAQGKRASPEGKVRRTIQRAPQIIDFPASVLWVGLRVTV